MHLHIRNIKDMMKKRKNDTTVENKKRRLEDKLLGSFVSPPNAIKNITPLIYSNIHDMQTSTNLEQYRNDNKLSFTVPSIKKKRLRTLKEDIADNTTYYNVTLENTTIGCQWNCSCYDKSYVKYDKSTKVCKHIKYVLMYIMQSTIEKEDLINDIHDLSDMLSNDFMMSETMNMKVDEQ